MEPVYNFQGMFTQSLGLKDPWSITKAVFDPQKRAVHIYISVRKTAKYPCPECGELCSRYNEEEDERVWRHADVVLYPCFVHSRRPRVRCNEHGVRVVDAPWARGPYARFTLGFEGYAMLLAQAMSMNEASRILRISRTAMLNIATYWVEKAVKEDDLSHVTRLSIDETSFKRGHSYVTMIGAPEEKRVIGVEVGRDVSAVERFSHLADLAAGDALNTKAFSKPLHLPGQYPLNKSFLNHLKQRCFVPFAFSDKEWDIAAISHLRHQQVHRAHSGIQSPRAKPGAVAGAFPALLVLLCSHLA